MSSELFNQLPVCVQERIMNALPIIEEYTEPASLVAETGLPMAGAGSNIIVPDALWKLGYWHHCLDMWIDENEEMLPKDESVQAFAKELNRRLRHFNVLFQAVALALPFDARMQKHVNAVQHGLVPDDTEDIDLWEYPSGYMIEQ